MQRRYVYYRCTNSRGACLEGSYREDLLVSGFAEIVGSLRLDRDVVAWVREALHESLREETAYHREAISRLAGELETVKQRMNQAYLDRVSGKNREDFWADRAAEWQAEKARIRERLARHQHAEEQFLETGLQMLELVQRAQELHLKRDAASRRRLFGLVLSGCTLRDGRLTPTYRQPFDLLARITAENAHGRLTGRAGDGGVAIGSR